MKSATVPMPADKIPTQAQLMSTWTGNPDKPLVTVICLTYNHERFIRNALHGFLIQRTTFPFRVIVHDDASTDQTAAIVREYERRFPRIIRGIYQTENLYSRKIDRSPYIKPLQDGEFIAWCEGDDYWTDPRKLEEQVRYLSDHPECALVCQPHINAEYVNGRLVSVGLAKERALTLTRMCRRSAMEHFPPELKGLPIGDSAHFFFLSTQGRVIHLSDLSPAVRVMHDGGVMSKQPRIVQLEKQVATWQSIKRYYEDSRYSLFLSEKLTRFRAEKAKALSYEARPGFRKVAHRVQAIYYRLRSLSYRLLLTRAADMPDQ